MIKLDDCSVVTNIDRFLKTHETIINSNRLSDKAKKPYVDRYNHVKQIIKKTTNIE